jgi:hypothetical protein
MKKIALTMLLMSSSWIYAHDLKQCDKSYKISATETFYGCETCMETDSGACVYTEASCYKVTTTARGEVKEKINCAPHTCGDVPRQCSILYTGIEELQSIEGQIVDCIGKTRQLCSKQEWIPYSK